MNYTNAEFRSIMNGLGYASSGVGPSFPISTNNSPLTDVNIVNGIKAFQRGYGLTPDGIAGPITKAKAAQVMRILQAKLNCVVNAGLPKNQPFYGPLTVQAVKLFELTYGYFVDGVATLFLRQHLNSFPNCVGISILADSDAIDFDVDSNVAAAVAVVAAAG